MFPSSSAHGSLSSRPSVYVHLRQVRVIEQRPCDGATLTDDPVVISFNIPMLWAKTGDFPEAKDEAFSRAPDAKRKKITISVDVPLMEPVRHIIFALTSGSHAEC